MISHKVLSLALLAITQLAASDPAACAAATALYLTRVTVWVPPGYDESGVSDASGGSGVASASLRSASGSVTGLATASDVCVSAVAVVDVTMTMR